MTSAEVAAALGVPRAQVADELNRAKLERLKVGGETAFVTPEALDALVAAIERELLAFHAENPKATGIATSALRDRVDRRLDAQGVRRGARRRRVARSRRRRGRSGAPPQGRRLAPWPPSRPPPRRCCRCSSARGSRPRPSPSSPPRPGTDVGVARKVLGRLASEGRVVRISSELHFSAGAIAGARELADARTCSAHPEGATAGELRDVLGVSRKYAIPLLEYFDAQGLTKREGDVRVLREVR